MDPALIFFFSSSKIQNASQIPSQIHSEVKIRNIIEIHQKYHPRLPNVPQNQKFSKFFWPKKNRAGGVLRERGLGTYTSPTLGVNKSHLLYSTNKKRKRSILTKLT